MCNLLSRIFRLAIFSIEDRDEDQFFPLLYIGGDSWSRNSIWCLQDNESHISSVKSKLCPVNTCRLTLVALEPPIYGGDPDWLRQSGVYLYRSTLFLRLARGNVAPRRV